MTSYQKSNHAKGAHVVAFPLPAGGHQARFFPFIKILSKNGFIVTVIIPTHYLAKAQQALVDNDTLETRHNIRIIGIDLFAKYSDVNDNDSFQAILPTIDKLKEPLKDIMKQLMGYGVPKGTNVESSNSHDPPPVCFISDFYLSWTQDIANEFNLPRYCFYPTTQFLSFIFSVPDFTARGLLPPKDGKPFKIPGFPLIAPTDVPKSLRYKKNERLVREGERLWEVAGVLVNSVYELESDGIDGLQKMIFKHSKQHQIGHVPKIMPIGPMVYENVQFCQGQQPFRERLLQQDAKDDNKCLQWLGQQPKMSVLYICLGSMSVFPMQQMSEFAAGLEASGVHFLWVVKVSSLLSTNESTIASHIVPFLSEGFMERTKNKGLIYTCWAPQLQILAHPAVAGFLTHCGWNSIMESIAMGVPMIAWPLWADHMLNRILCVDILNIALPIPNNSDDSTPVGREDIERVIRLLMEDTRGEVIKKKVEEVGKITEMATRPGGSSWKNLFHFVEEVKSLSAINK